MAHEETICPYTGLRSFSEEESLYFRGRDGQISRVIGQLEERKFLMLTGASGDGKSSLVFAGLIPQARAGFFKAKHLNWKVVTFRPERSPLKNLATSLASELRMDAGVVENELSHGFSALTEIYKSTSTFIDTKDSSFTNATDEERESMDREAGNLLVIVDQFEEFFTNPENFHNGVPSQDSRLVLNILLETVKISLRDDLPIYIVFTMRSDYIGQCAAFRGLPEFIGFSQFFVPRLQRKELQEVIEEPAVLSGNSISKRLIDRLIYDLEETEDHLPILQHALKEMWKVADEGRQEIDLVHYEKVGGKLSKILDLHANNLYQQASAVHKDAKRIIAITFACLTRIDENRAVRNRMTLEEITGIINMPGVTTSVVDDVLRVFREPGNTLVRPFIDENGANRNLSPDSVLDITHEALIRNWKMLNKWASKEFEYYNTYLDFNKQLQRWIDNGQSSNYLLPVGPLTYFENWFKESRPNAWWIKRYDLSEANEQLKLEKAQQRIELSSQFLKKSASRVLVTRSFMKYGAGRITAAVALIAVLVVGGFMTYKWWSHRNESVINRVLKQGEVLLQNNPDQRKVQFIETATMVEPTYFKKVLGNSKDDLERTETATYLAWRMLQMNPPELPPLFYEALKIADSLIVKVPQPAINDAKAVTRYLHVLNSVVNLETDYLYFHPEPGMQSDLDRHAKTLSRFTYRLYTEGNPSTRWDKKALSVATSTSLALKAFSSDSISNLIAALSPFEADSMSLAKFDQLFAPNETVEVGFDRTLTHNGGYELLAHLFASTGNWKNAARCVDSVDKYNQFYAAFENNQADIGATFFRYHYPEAGKEYLKSVSAKEHISLLEYMNQVGRQAGIFAGEMAIRSNNNGNFNPTSTLLTVEEINDVFRIYQSLIDEVIKDKNGHDFETAMILKYHGSVLSKKSLEKKQPIDTLVVHSLFRKAVQIFEALPRSFLDEEVEVFSLRSGTNTFALYRISRYRMFIYPDHFTRFNNAFSNAFCVYYSDTFFKYIYNNHLVEKWYHTPEDFALLTQWVGYSFLFKDIRIAFSKLNEGYNSYPPIDKKMLYAVDSLIITSGFDKSVDNSWIILTKVNDLLKAGNKDEALRQFKRLNLVKLSNKKGFDYEMIPFENFLIQTGNALLKAGFKGQASKFVSRFRAPDLRMIQYTALGIASFDIGDIEDAKRYLDSSYMEIGKVELVDNYFRGVWDIRQPMAQLVAMLKGPDGKKEILEITGDMGDRKASGIGAVVFTLTAQGDNYAAEITVPSLSNANDKLFIFSRMLAAEAMKGKKPGDANWTVQNEIYSRMDKFIVLGGNTVTTN